MDYPTPVFRGGKWHLDLRSPWHLGRHILDAPPPPDGQVLALHLAWTLFVAEQKKAEAIGSQPRLPGLDGVTLAKAIEEYLAYRSSVRRWKTAAGEAWCREICHRLRFELGKRALSEFAPPDGTRMLVRYRDLVRKGDPAELTRLGFGRPLGPKRMQDVFTVLGQVLHFAAGADRGWLSALPDFPDPTISPDEVIRRGLDKWVDEQTFRAARTRIYEHPVALAALVRELRRSVPGATAADAYNLICRRRLFLSFAFYTGMRRHDLWLMDDRSVSADFARYARFGRKTGVAVSAEVCPPPLLADIRAELDRIGRRWRRGEAICGGKWKNVCRVLAAACDAAGVERFNLRDCRRSFVWHKAAAGIPEADIIRLLGHHDSKMIRTVYQQHLPAAVADAASAAWPKSVTSKPGTGDARVIPLHSVP